MAIPLRDRPADRRASAPTVGSIRPKLRSVPARRRLAGFVVIVTFLVAALMMGAVLLHTTIAERQLEFDRLDRGVRAAQADFDMLRAERAELRSPTRIAELARGLGMGPGEESTFVDVDPMRLAEAIATTGVVPIGDQATADLDTPIGIDLAPIEQFLLVKRVSGVQP